MGTFTLRLSEVLEILHNESMDDYDFQVQYESMEFEGVAYGKLPVLVDYEDVGLAHYPIFNENYRKILNGKIIDEYFNREIGMETIDDWKLALRRKMDQIMPFYNKLYESEKIEFNPLATMDIHSVSSGTNTSEESTNATVNNESTTTSKGRAVNSETPQTQLAGMADYATSATDSNTESGVTGENTTSGASEATSNNESESRVTGFQGVASELLVRYRNSLLNIDTMILRDIEDCFMLILNNGDAYTKQGWLY